MRIFGFLCHAYLRSIYSLSLLIVFINLFPADSLILDGNSKEPLNPTNLPVILGN